MGIRIALTSVSIDDYDKALHFYTDILGFETVVSPKEPNGTELLLEPNAEYPAMKALKEALVKDGIPFTAFEVDDIQEEYARLKDLGVSFTMEPTNTGPSIVAMFDDTCGNLIQIFEVTAG
jgi:catechol 2,3-dioxygenase-like lactoylglutathione lyase family enzyme